MPSQSKPTSCKIVLNILGYREEEEWVALALEMDLRGYGRTFEAAVKDLSDLVGMQISFAHFKRQPEMILRPADPIWFERFAQVRSSCLAAMVRSERHSARGDYKIAGLPIPDPHVIQTLQDKFTLAHA